MFSYGILLLTLIPHFKWELLDVFQSWYSDDGARMARIPRLLEFFDRLCVLGAPFGYFGSTLWLLSGTIKVDFDCPTWQEATRHTHHSQAHVQYHHWI